MLEIVCGPMFAGKSETLCAIFRDKPQGTALVIKSAVDDRDSTTKIVTHQGASVPAISVHSAGDILSLVTTATESVLIDEAQFFGPALVPVLRELDSRGLDVYLFGLDMDSNRLPFGCMGDFMAMATSVQKLRALCDICGRPARFTKRMAANGDRVFVGGAERYGPRCGACWDVYPEGMRR